MVLAHKIQGSSPCGSTIFSLKTQGICTERDTAMFRGMNNTQVIGWGILVGAFIVFMLILFVAFMTNEYKALATAAVFTVVPAGIVGGIMTRLGGSRVRN